MLVTGCSRGIGYEIALRGLKKGWSVIGTARSRDFPAELANADKFEGHHVDLSDPKQFLGTLKPVFKRRPQLLINNAGIFTDADFNEQDDRWLSVWDHTMNVNLRSPALLCKWFLNEHLSEGTKATIINIASRASYRGDTQEYAAYAASKAGLVALTKSIARDFSRRGVVAYSVAPGFIETDMARDAIKLLGQEHVTSDTVFDEITQPAEVAELVLFLGDGKVPHASGQTFHINAGSYMI